MTDWAAMMRNGWTLADVQVLTRWMADHDYHASEVAYAVEKPWKFQAEWESIPVEAVS